MAKNTRVSNACLYLLHNFKQRRMELGISVEEIQNYLRRFGFEREEKTIYGWEAGQSEPPFEVILLLARLLGFFDLFAASDFAYEGEKEEIPLSPAEKSLVCLFRTNPAFRKVVLDLLALTNEE